MIVFVLMNHGVDLYTVKTGDKIAQIVFMKKENVEFIKVNSLDELGKTKRGALGFGSSDSKKVKVESDNEEVILVEEASMSVNGEEVIREKSVIID